MGHTKPGVYVVFRGRTPGIYDTWPKCEEQITRYPGAIHRKFNTASEADFALAEWQRTVDAQPMVSLLQEEPVNDGAAPALTVSPTAALQRVPSFTSTESASSPILYTPSLKRSATFSPRLSITSLHTANFKIIDRVDLTSYEPDGLEEPPAKRFRTETPDPIPEILHLPGGFNESNVVRYQGYEEPQVKLSPEQDQVLQLALSKKNIFLTGAAGCGKTVTLKEILRRMRNRQDNVQVIAPTGIAALPLGGKTTYSFAGWNIDSFRTGIDELLRTTRRKTAVTIVKLKVLVIEEISMVENQFLERLNLLFQHVLQNKRPFGGKQVIFLGDFHQLPPVKPFEHCLYCGEPIHVLQEFVCVSEVCRRAHTQPSFKEGDKWAFKAPVWKQLDLRHVRLEQIHRQKDTRFQDILNKIRNSQPLSAAEWADLERRKDLPNDACPTRLMSRVAQVRAFNYRELAALKSQPKTWKAMDSCKKLAKAEGDEFDHSIPFKVSEHRASLRDHTFPEDLTLKVGARVVLLHNLDHERGLVNGSQGKIIGFQKDPDEIKKVLEISGGDHKDFRHVSMMDYHASNIDWRPLVHFTNGVTRLIPAIAAASIRGPGNRYEQYVVCRTQIPLALAWALSIHKSQGMTLEYVEVSSRDIFESGQLYVALSRATHLNGLKLTGFSRNQLPMDANVLKFYTETKWEKLQSCEEEYLEELLAADECVSSFSEGEPTVSVAVDDTTRPLPDSPLLNASAALCNNHSMTFQRVLGTVDCLPVTGLDTVPPRTQSGEP